MILEHRVQRNTFGGFRWRAVFSVGQKHKLSYFVRIQKKDLNKIYEIPGVFENYLGSSKRSCSSGVPRSKRTPNIMISTRILHCKRSEFRVKQNEKLSTVAGS
jgi:hypothetical protein